MPALWPHVQSGRLRALAVTSEKRSTIAPEVPTLNESGAKGLVFSAWKGLMVAAATPDDIVKRLNNACNKALAKPEFRKKLIELGAEPVGNTPEQFAAQIKQETATWAALVKSTGARVD
jgi:tripartite-type tricarboxylate transporter receptor subunit TctC